MRAIEIASGAEVGIESTSLSRLKLRTVPPLADRMLSPNWHSVHLAEEATVATSDHAPPAYFFSAVGVAARSELSPVESMNAPPPEKLSPSAVVTAEKSFTGPYPLAIGSTLRASTNVPGVSLSGSHAGNG